MDLEKCVPQVPVTSVRLDVETILGPNGVRSSGVRAGDDLSLCFMLNVQGMPLDDSMQGGLCKPPYSFTFSSFWSFDARRHTLTRAVPCLQMSSEGSSGRANSGNAFEGNSLCPSNPGDRQTPEFSWTDFLRWESASHQDDAAQGSSRLAGKHGEDEASSSNQVEWSCAHSTLTLIGQEVRRLVEHYKIEVMIPPELCRVHKPPRGYVTTSKMFLKFGVRFLLRQFF